MIKIPRYEPQVNTKVAPTPQVDPGAFGMDVAKAKQNIGNQLSELGKMVQQRALELQQREDERQVQEAQNKFRYDLDSLLHDRQKGLLNRQMGDAVNVNVDYEAEAKKIKEKYLSGLRSPLQQTVFSNNADNYTEAGRVTVLDHEHKEFQKNEAKTYDDAAALDEADVKAQPGRLAELSASSDKRAEVYYRGQGYTDPKMIATEQQRERGRLALAAGSGLAEKGDFQGALNIYKNNELNILLAHPDALTVKEGWDKGQNNNLEQHLYRVESAAGKANGDLNKAFTEIDSTVDQMTNLTDDAKQVKKEQHHTLATESHLNYLVMTKQFGQARKVLDAIGEKLDSGKRTEWDDMIDKKEFDARIGDDWDNTISHFTLSDGTFDMGKANKYVDANYPQDQREDAKLRFTKRGNAMDQARNDRRNATMHTGTNNIADVFLKGGTYDQGLAEIGKLTDPEQGDRIILMNYAKSLWGISDGDDPMFQGVHTNWELWRDLEYMANNEGLDQNALDGLAKQHRLSSTDYRYFTALIATSRTAEQKMTNKLKSQAIIDFVPPEFKKGSADYQNFVTTATLSTQNSSLEETFNWLKKNTTKEPNGKKKFFFFEDEDYKFKIDREKMIKLNKGWGKRFDEFGAPLIGYVLESWEANDMRQKNPKNRKANIVDFEQTYQQVGGVTPMTIAASHSLMNKGIMVTPQNIRIEMDLMGYKPSPPSAPPKKKK